jgi:hypothetical protein
MLNTSFLTKGKYPYTIEACPPWDVGPPYPTHTHGLYEMGLPEFIMDPLAFGGEGNAQRINSAYDYLIDPKNTQNLAAILNGQTIKLTGPQLDPIYMLDDPCVYCLREVPPSFEAVRQAYGSGVTYLIPPMRFIQIWVDGDDFALTDEYYRGGVTW